MSVVVNSHIIGPHTCRPTQAQLDTIKNYDRGLGSPGLHRFVEMPASWFVIKLDVHTTANNNAKSSVKYAAPRPYTIWSVDVACESAAGSAGTVDVLADAGSGGASILAAAVDVKTAAGTAQRATPESDKCNIDYGTKVYITQTGTGSGDMVGGQAMLYCQLR